MDHAGFSDLDAGFEHPNLVGGVSLAACLSYGCEMTLNSGVRWLEDQGDFRTASVISVKLGGCLDFFHFRRGKEDQNVATNQIPFRFAF
jgi:hypothetical protein